MKNYIIFGLVMILCIGFVSAFTESIGDSYVTEDGGCANDGEYITPLQDFYLDNITVFSGVIATSINVYSDESFSQLVASSVSSVGDTFFFSGEPLNVGINYFIVIEGYSSRVIYSQSYPHSGSFVDWLGRLDCGSIPSDDYAHNILSISGSPALPNLNSGLVAFFPNAVADTVGSHTGVPHNGASVVGGALVLNGVDQYVSLPNPVVFGNAMTVTFLIKAIGGQDDTVVALCQDNTFGGLMVDWGYPALLYSGQSNWRAFEYNTVSKDDLWHRYVWTFNPSNSNTGRLWIDGVEQGVQTDYQYDVPAFTQIDLFGRFHTPYPQDYYLNGQLKDVGVWNRTLFESEILLLDNTSYGNPCSENWVLNVQSCDGLISSYTSSYIDQNYCGTFTSVPVDNGTVVPCCVENWVENDSECNGLNETELYVDTNMCNTTFQLPISNGTVSSCFLGNVKQIFNCEQLLDVDSNLSASYKLMNDIDCSGNSPFTPIGDSVTPFSGILYGQGHTISGIINIPYTYAYRSIFGASAGTIRDVNVVLSVTDNRNGGTFMSGLVGVNSGLIDNCHVNNSVLTNRYGNVAGLVCENYGTITRSSFSGSLSNRNTGSGGLVQNNYGNISSSYATGSFSAGGSTIHFAGFVYANTGVINNSYSRMYINTFDSGSFAGFVENNVGIIDNSYSTGGLTNPNNVAKTLKGFVASNTGSCSNSYWDYQSSTIIPSACGSPKFTDDMKLQSTFANWDFNNVWVMDSNVNDGYPSFRSSPVVVPTTAGGGRSSGGTGGRSVDLSIVPQSVLPNAVAPTGVSHPSVLLQAWNNFVAWFKSLFVGG